MDEFLRMHISANMGACSVAIHVARMITLQKITHTLGEVQIRHSFPGYKSKAVPNSSFLCERENTNLSKLFSNITV
jgi:hypothetical protein